eukprot:gene56712-biopygen26765
MFASRGRILCGVAYLHGHGIIHRDIKGDNEAFQKNVFIWDEKPILGHNVLVDTATGLGEVKISDFGSSRVAGATAAACTLAGTPNWMAPELITRPTALGAEAPKVDVWSVGCTVVDQQMNSGSANAVVELLNRGVPPWPQFDSQWAALHHIAAAAGPPEGIPTSLSEPCRALVDRHSADD